ncbi:MAG: VOC family protein [Gammaproteobacteria bacterium]|nr:VOC family protein [Gammaproteobacteria bacterium]
MKIRLNSIHVDDQARALDFYTNTLGFEKKHDIPMGEFRWLTVVSVEEPAATELLLEPNSHPAARAYQTALYADGIPTASFEVSDVDTEFSRLKEQGVQFTTEPTPVGDSKIAMFDDTCGNLVQLYEAPGD